ncbi:uncharacterized protein LOC109861276 isoform X3 [Pseudomyrmex gracilis]|uniref:uncharacterized protein LOC109861276 isoform X3 n=1 Tax=Pseudomyrmex gracilis TaxID=219809 RepID=UPI00099571D9|nr:uncharacterized protein LOC109861276 isoform X3 [Pseudomyrmex gracilis]
MNPDEPSTSSESKPRKRTHSNIELEVESEQTKQQEHVPIQEKKAKERQATNILDCPDILLFRIFQHVDKEDLRNLSLCCTKFSRIALHEVFWTYDYTNKPILPSQMEPYENFLEPLTHTLKIRGDFKQKTENILERSFFFQVKQICQILHTLKLRNYLINLDEVTPEMSTNIVRLLFSNCIASSSIGLVFNTTYFFRGICRFVPHVQSLLDANKFEEILMYRNNQFQNYLLSNISRCISRCTNLKKLHIRHYSHVTRTDINIISSTLSNLVELDITGCSVTLEDVKHFKSQRPNVKTYSSFSTRHEMYE